MFSFRSKPAPDAPATAAAPAPAQAVLEAIEPISPIEADVELKPYRVDEPVVISTMLRLLADNDDLVSFHRGIGAAPLSGRIVAVQAEAGAFTFEARVREQAPESGAALCVAMPRGVKLQFRAELQWAAGIEPGASLLRGTAALPRELVHLQRRGAPRLDLPLGASLRVEVLVNGRARQFSLDDLSLGGFGLRGPVPEGRGIMVGQLLKARLLLDDGAALLLLPLEVRSRRHFRSFLAGEQVHLGCRFGSLDETALATLRQLLAQLEAARSRG